MKHIQNEKDLREIPIDRVGIKDLKYPIIVWDKSRKKQNTVATVNMYVDLPKEYKGTHMSRFIEILNDFRGDINMEIIPEILHKMKNTLNATSSHIEFHFPYFIEKEAPKSKIKSLTEYTGIFYGKSDNKDDFVLGAKVPVTSVCPCSKEISEKGAHNQRSIVHARIRFKDFVWLEDLIAIIENCASAPTFSILKREDEKFITENSYDNPVFVEDIVRNVATQFKENSQIYWYFIETESFESIHNHNAYAYIKSKTQ